MNFCWFLGWKEGGETVRDGSVRGQGAQEPINPPSLGGWKFFFEGVGGGGGDHTEFKGNRGDISRRRQQSMKWGVG